MRLPRLDFAKVLPPVLLALAIANFLLACHVGRQNYPTVIEKVSVITNVVSSADSDFSSLSVSNSVSSVPLVTRPSLVTNSPSQVCETSYQYFITGRRIGCKMFGRFYFEGSPCSYGRIDSIYPDRILLSSGDWIQNLQRFEDGNLIVSDSSERKVRTNDRPTIH